LDIIMGHPEEHFKSIDRNKEKLTSLFKEYKQLDKAPVLVTKMPRIILDEMNLFVKKCREIKNHELGFLREHHNAGDNAYQISVPIADVYNSFTWPYLVMFGQFYLFKFNKLKFKNTFREVFLRRTAHYDGYDFWINYTEKGSVNQWHDHEGYLSGVIYLKNTKNTPTIFKEGNIEYGGDVGEICIFPASLEHSVGEYLQDDERITASFNLVWEEVNYGG
tara:strand:- start:658 stop:1317 length:660 start_codon:yes stop_codon:yes gene_type:complete